MHPVRSFGRFETMLRFVFSAFVLFLAAQGCWAEERLLVEQVPSRFLNAPRLVRIYLPLSYGQQPARRYPVLYLHDGQNVYSSAGTNIAFGWGKARITLTTHAIEGLSENDFIVAAKINTMQSQE